MSCVRVCVNSVHWCALSFPVGGMHGGGLKVTENFVLGFVSFSSAQSASVPFEPLV